VLLEATLSFSASACSRRTPSWGNIIFENQSYFQAAPWLVFFPGAIILLTGAVVQSGRRCAARHPRSDAKGPGMIAYLVLGA
jgi:ABC-type antimicrobial peptide transport system permease subunit